MKNKEISFECDIAYAQVCVFQTSLENPYNDWTDEHVSQGFSWRKGSVAFGALDAINSKVKVKFEDKMIAENGIRMISVPFEVVDEEVEVGGLFDSKVIEIPNGKYELIIQIYIIDIEYVEYVLTFIKNDKAVPKIWIADDEINIPHEFDMSAKPAI